MAKFEDSDWMCQFNFLVDMTNHWNELNACLHGKDQLIESVFDHIKAFEVKLCLWESQLWGENFVHFPTLLKVQCTQLWGMCNHDF